VSASTEMMEAQQRELLQLQQHENAFVLSSSHPATNPSIID
jgi:hypothetical protein